MLFIACWNAADDEGLLRWSSAYLKAIAFIYDEDVTPAHVQGLMDELVNAGLVFAYRGGKTNQSLGWIVSFAKYQKPNRPQPSKLPPPSLQNPAIRAAYAERDGWLCGVCGDEIPKGQVGNVYDGGLSESSILSLDHIHPRSKGGSDYPSNIRATHKSCNSHKGSRTDSLNDSLNASPSEAEPLNDLFTSGEEGRGEEKEGRGGSESEPSGSASPPRGTPSIPPDAELFAAEFRDALLAVHEGMKPPTPAAFDRWRHESRRMLDRDGRRLDEMRDVASWLFDTTRADEDASFWRSNVLSVPKFREKFDQLRAVKARARADPLQRDYQRRDQVTQATLRLAEARKSRGP